MPSLICQSAGLPPERCKDILMLGSSQLSCTLQALCTFQLKKGACRQKLVDGKCPIKHRVKLVTKHANCRLLCCIVGVVVFMFQSSMNASDCAQERQACNAAAAAANCVHHIANLQHRQSKALYHGSLSKLLEYTCVSTSLTRHCQANGFVDVASVSAQHAVR